MARDSNDPGAGVGTRALPVRKLSGWGHHPVVEGIELCSDDLADVTRGAALSRGLGRAYGDASLPPSRTRPIAGTRLADRLLEFDPGTGVLRAEAGLSLRDLNAVFLPRGWFPPVTPGTQDVTLGGMVAADVHGKNHHAAGTFGDHVRSLRLRIADGRILEVSEESERELFRATLGGMGLTGHILEVSFVLERIPSPWISWEREAAPDLAHLIDALEVASKEWPLTVAWLDSTRPGQELGRGVLTRGRWASASAVPAGVPSPGRRLSVPLWMPSGLLNRASISLLNRLYFWKQGRGKRRGVTDPYRFFYPLDGIGHWNRLYGRRGFTQYQCVLPSSGALQRDFLQLFQRLGGASFVTVVKDFGAEGRGLLSFPKPGITIALDIPIGSRPERTQALVDGLNEFVIEHGGRVYLAKDALTRPEHFRAMEPRLEKWLGIRARWDPEGRLASAQSVRLLGDRA